MTGSLRTNDNQYEQDKKENSYNDYMTKLWNFANNVTVTTQEEIEEDDDEEKICTGEKISCHVFEKCWADADPYDSYAIDCTNYYDSNGHRIKAVNEGYTTYYYENEDGMIIEVSYGDYSMNDSGNQDCFTYPSWEDSMYGYNEGDIDCSEVKEFQ